MSNDETQYNLTESADKIRLTTKLKRGTGTRDQDTHTLKVRGESPKEAAEALEEVVSELKQRAVFAKARQVGDSDD